MSRKTVPDRIDALQWLRGLAAMAVFLSHISQAEKEHFGRHLAPGFGAGAFGVDLFFVLSGFVIVHSALGRPTGGRAALGFAVARLGRIFPPYWAVLAPCLLVASLFGPAWVTDATYAPLLQTVLLLPAADPPLLHPAWSLVHELYFYALLAGLTLAPRRWLPPALLLWAFAMVSVQAMLGGRVVDPVLHLVANPLNLEFLLGAVVRLALPWLKPAWPRRQAAVFGLLLLAGALALTRILQTQPEGEAWRVALAGLPAAGLVAAATGLRADRWPRLSAVLKGLGDRSYVLYLAQFPICTALALALSHSRGQAWGATLAYVLGCLAITAAVTEVLHRLVERPSLRLAHALARRLSRRRPRPEAVNAQAAAAG